MAKSVTIASPQFFQNASVREWIVQQGVIEGNTFIPNASRKDGHVVQFNNKILFNGMTDVEFAEKAVNDFALRKRFENMPESGRFHE